MKASGLCHILCTLLAKLIGLPGPVIAALVTTMSFQNIGSVETWMHLFGNQCSVGNLETSNDGLEGSGQLCAGVISNEVPLQHEFSVC